MDLLLPKVVVVQQTMPSLFLILIPVLVLYL
jgi:hypothetical protein